MYDYEKLYIYVYIHNLSISHFYETLINRLFSDYLNKIKPF